MPINYDQTGVVYDSTTYTYDGEVFSPSVFPTAGVFIAWNDGPYVANPGWTEITPYVREISIRRGRADDFEQFDTGTAQLVLDNRARTFDPFYTSGPNYLKLTPRRQIKIVAQIGGVNYDVFRGYVAGWPVTWSEAGYDSTVTIQAFDALGLMANEQVPTDWPGYVIGALNPIHYWKANDARTSSTIIDKPASGQVDLTLSLLADGVKFEQAPLSDGCVGNSLYVENIYSGLKAAPATLQPDMTLTTMMSNPNPTGVSGQINAYAQGNYIWVYWSVQASTLTIDCSNATTYRTSQFTIRVSSQPIHLAVVMTANAGGTPAMSVYVNNVLQTATLTASGARGATAQESMNLNRATFQEIALFASALSTSNLTDIYSACTGRFSETSTARMNRLIGTTTYPTLLASFTASPAATVAEIGSGTGVIPEMQLVADSEGGEIYVSKSGILTTTNRTDVFNATRSANVQATITDSGTGLRYGTDLEIQYDADALKNDVTVNYSGDGEVSATSSAVISAYGASSTVIETQLADPTSAQQLALMELGVEGSLVPRISPIDVSSNTAAADWQTILGLELLDRVTFKRTPSVGNQFSRDALVNAIEHQIVPGVWRTQLTLSMRYTSPLTLDDDVLGTLDFNYLG